MAIPFQVHHILPVELLTRNLVTNRLNELL
jgi:hypothetical protein